ncbi:MAG: hypothetical protein DI551_02370 [Micavibrio aeruginosavorus]|uniref:Lipoprotein n=1 Tax=Micavibrio aeruginosavorus TaxID=349221 RepID=A0A2W5Q9H4_9BACT|nr:MAG: hypothetical protein DI551_02370 [Micavibrio aeruginosavorus]
MQNKLKIIFSGLAALGASACATMDSPDLSKYQECSARTQSRMRHALMETGGAGQTTLVGGVLLVTEGKHLCRMEALPR